MTLNSCDTVFPFDSDVKVLSEVASSAEVTVKHIFFKVFEVQDATISNNGFKSSSQLTYTLSKSNINIGDFFFAFFG